MFRASYGVRPAAETRFESLTLKIAVPIIALLAFRCATNMRFPILRSLRHEHLFVASWVEALHEQYSVASRGRYVEISLLTTYGKTR